MMKTIELKDRQISALLFALGEAWDRLIRDCEFTEEELNQIRKPLVQALDK